MAWRRQRHTWDETAKYSWLQLSPFLLAVYVHEPWKYKSYTTTQGCTDTGPLSRVHTVNFVPSTGNVDIVYPLMHKLCHTKSHLWTPTRASKNPSASQLASARAKWSCRYELKGSILQVGKLVECELTSFRRTLNKLKYLILYIQPVFYLHFDKQRS